MKIEITGVLSEDNLCNMFTITQTVMKGAQARSILCKVASKVPTGILLDGKKITVAGQWSEPMQCLLVGTIIID